MHISQDKLASPRSLDLFLQNSLELDSYYLTERDTLGKNWIKFNTKIASSLVKLYEFNLDLYNAVEFDYKTSRYYSFYSDFVVSKPSSSIFTETPKNTFIDLFPRKAERIKYIGTKLYNKAKNVTQYDAHEDTEFNQLFQTFFTNTFAYYDFIYSGDKGAFSKFDTNENLYKKQKQYLTKIETIESYEKLKDFLLNIPIANIDIATKYFKQEDINFENINTDSQIVYENYINNQNSKDNTFVIFEIFTYVLSAKLWKFIKIAQRSLEFKKQDDIENTRSEFLIKIKEYIQNQLEILNTLYESDMNESHINKYYLDVHNEDYPFITDFIFEDLLHDIEDEILISDECFEKCSVNRKFMLDTKQELSDKELINLLNPIIDINEKTHERFKFYRLLSKGTSEDISTVVNLMHNLIIKNVGEKELKNIEYIGILRSGSFLAHALNILKQSITQNSNHKVASLLTHPYLTILPRLTSYRDNNGCKRFVYIDEVVKSGYSLSITDIYRKKILSLNDIDKCNNDMAFSISDMVDYKPKTLTVKSKSLLNVKIIDSDITNRKELEFSTSVKKFSTKNTFDWKAFLNSLNKDLYLDDENKFDLEKKILSKQIHKLSHVCDDRFDITRVISNSYMLFSISKYLVTQLMKQDINSKKLLFYTGSQEGQLITDIMIFIGKIIYKEEFNKDIYINAKTMNSDDASKNKDSSLLIFIDMSIDSEYTKNNVFKLDVKKEFGKKNFDLTFSIFDSNINPNNIFINTFN